MLCGFRRPQTVFQNIYTSFNQSQDSKAVECDFIVWKKRRLLKFRRFGDTEDGLGLSYFPGLSNLYSLHPYKYESSNNLLSYASYLSKLRPVYITKTKKAS